MSDLISRQDVLDYIDTMPSELTSDGRRMVRRIMLTEYIADTLPSAEPQIIRCKDCKKAPKCYGDVLMKSKGGGYIYCPLEYCSEAERKDNG